MSDAIRHPVPACFAVALLVSIFACSESEGPLDPGRTGPIQLEVGSMIGRDVFPIGNSAQGGQGEEIAGIGCIKSLAYHEHAHVSLFVAGEQIAIPAGLGIVDPVEQNGVVGQGSCLYWLHTHEASGIIHVEPPTDIRLNLGQMFDVWGYPLSSDNIAGYEGDVRVWINGVEYTGDPRAIEFTQQRQITLQVGSPLAPVPSYIFPEGY